MTANKVKLIMVLFIVILTSSLAGCSSNTTDKDTIKEEPKKIEVIFDAPTFSRISKEALFEKFGETKDIEKWNNKTAKGTFLMTIYSYDDENNIHYEFIIANDIDSVVRVTIYSEKDWSGKGADFKYANKSVNNMLGLLNIIPKDSAKVVADTGEVYRISPVSNDVGDVWFLGMLKDSSTFSSVKITYNLNYFD